MRIVRIITLYGNNNFGNKLQNYALQTYIENTFHDTKVITYKASKNIIRYIINSIKSALNARERLFILFNKNINYDFKVIKYDNPIIKNKNDVLLFGSDQIWNTDFEGNTKLFSGNFKYNGTKISYAASFGKNKIDDKYIEDYRNSLSSFKYLSVREDKGKKIIEKVINRKDVEILIDPTMLLSSKEWDKVAKKPKQLDKISEKKYILNYFLGNLSNSRKKEIERIAKKNNCRIINILDKNDPFYISGPSEFLYLEKHAFLICTDSFHSSVFAILYNKPFIIFEREQNNMEKMNSRIDTLISKFRLKNRKYNENKITKENLKHNYTEAYKILEKEREKSKKFIEKALDIKNR